MLAQKETLTLSDIFQNLLLIIWAKFLPELCAYCAPRTGEFLRYPPLVDAAAPKAQTKRVRFQTKGRPNRLPNWERRPLACRFGRKQAQRPALPWPLYVFAPQKISPASCHALNAWL